MNDELSPKDFAISVLTPSDTSANFDSDLFDSVVFDPIPAALLAQRKVLQALLMILAGVFALALSVSDLVPAVPAMLFSCFCVISGALMLVYIEVVKQRALKKYKKVLKNCHLQLSTLQTLITGYLERFDTRTRKYFHCVTHGKVSLYFRLRQIENGLGSFSKKFAETIEKPSKANFLKAQEMLGLPFEYRDGVKPNTGELHKTRVSELKDTVAALIAELHASILELEAQIKSTTK